MFFYGAIKNSFTLSFDSWTTDKKFVRTSEKQVDIGSAVKGNTPTYLIAARQTAARSGVANKTIHVSVFDHIDVKRYRVEIDGKRYPKNSVAINYATNDYLDQYRDIKLFYEEYAEEPLLKPFRTY